PIDECDAIDDGGAEALRSIERGAVVLKPDEVHGPSVLLVCRGYGDVTFAETVDRNLTRRPCLVSKLGDEKFSNVHPMPALIEVCLRRNRRTGRERSGERFRSNKVRDGEESVAARRRAVNPLGSSVLGHAPGAGGQSRNDHAGTS